MRKHSTSTSLAAGAAAALLLLGAGPAAMQAAAQEAAPATSPRLVDLAPAQTLFYMRVADTASARAAFDKTRLSSVAKELEPFFRHVWGGVEPMRKELEAEIERNTGLNVWDALDALGGGVELAILGFDPDRGAPNVALAIGLAGREAKVDAVLAALKEMTGGAPALAAYEHQGVQVEVFGEPPMHFAKVSGKLLVTLFPEDMQGLIDRAKGAGGAGLTAASLSHGASYGAVSNRVTAAGKPTLLEAYVNVDGIFRDILLPQVDDEQRAIMEATGLLDVKAIGLAFTFDGEAMASRFYVAAPVSGERQGVLGLFQFGPADTSLVRLAPSSSASVFMGKLDLAKLYDRAFALMERIDPAVRGEAEAAIADYETRMGLPKLRDEVLAPLGEDWVAFSFPPPGGGLPAWVISTKLKDAAAFVAGQEKLAAAIGGTLSTIDMGGRTYRYMQGPVGTLGEDPFRSLERDERKMVGYVVGSTFGQAWTVEGDQLYMSDMPHSLADYFDVLGAEGSLADSEGWKKAATKLPKGQLVSWSDPRRYFPAGYNLIAKVLKYFEGIARQAGVPLDLNRLPRAQAIARHLAPGVTTITLDGEGLAMETTATLGGIDETVVAAAVVGVVAAIAVPNLMEARKGANESAAISSLRTLVTVQSLYRDADKDGDGAANFAGSLVELYENGRLIDEVLASGEKQGYRFIISADPSGFAWTAEAHPVEPGRTGDRYFFVDESGVIRFEHWEPASVESPPIGW